MESPVPAIVLYGIPNCDQVRRARRFLASHGVSYHFHDLRRDGLPAELLDDWLTHLPWDSLVNRRGTTWRRMPEPDRARIQDARSAQDALLADPTLVKRPVLRTAEDVLVGFSEAVYLRTLGLGSAAASDTSAAVDP